MIYTSPVDAEIIAIGSELLTPFFQDTNSLHLTERLNQLGVDVHFKTVVGDRRDDLVAAARVALARAQVVIFMGGLGPTEDDLTRECVAEALGIGLKRDPSWIAELYKRFAERKWKVSPNNDKQADVLEGAQLIPNARGTAPGQFLETTLGERAVAVMLLPGPPWELKPMFDEQMLPLLQDVVPRQFIATRVLRVAMIGESSCDARIAPIYKRYPAVETTILASAGDIQLHLRCRKESLDEAQEHVDALADELEDELGDLVYSTKGETLEQIVEFFLELKGATIAVAESCTGGMVGERLTSLSGSSRSFLGGAIVYSNDLKSDFADVPPLLIAAHGAVSKEVAAALAEGIRKRCKATLGLGITGIAGPSGGTPEKPVGLVYLGLSDGHKTEVLERNFTGDRDRIRRYATQQALDIVRRKLM